MDNFGTDAACPDVVSIRIDELKKDTLFCGCNPERKFARRIIESQHT